MESIVRDLVDSFGIDEIPRDDTGSLAAIAKILEDCQPRLLLLADAQGHLIAADDAGSGADLAAARPLALELSEGLGESETYRSEASIAAGSEPAFAVRLGEYAAGGLFGGLVGGGEALTSRFDQLRTTLRVCGAFAQTAVRAGEETAKSHARIKHLLAEQDVLRASHAEATTAAIEEREERLRAQQEQMRLLHDVMMMAADGIVTINEHGVIESFNKAAGQIFGYSPDEVIGRNVSMLAPPSDCEEHEAQLTEYLGARKKEILNLAREATGQRKDGTIFPVELSVSEVILSDRSIYTVILRDITERMAMERQLVQAQKLEAIGHLAAGIAHEINTPIQYIGNNTEFLGEAFAAVDNLLSSFDRLLAAAKDQTLTEELIAEIEAALRESDLSYMAQGIPTAIEDSLEGVNQVSRIVHAMKEFSHPGNGRMQTVDLNRTIENALAVSRNEWKYVADVATELDPELPPVNCLPNEFNQVVLNLVVNAAHAITDVVGEDSGVKGLITVSTRQDGDWVEIRIADTGSGIPEEIRSKVFDHFFTTKEVGRGTGQGLAIVHSVVTDKHQGTITFETTMDWGTTFIIRLPLGAEAAGREEEAAQSEKPE